MFMREFRTLEWVSQRKSKVPRAPPDPPRPEGNVLRTEWVNSQLNVCVVSWAIESPHFISLTFPHSTTAYFIQRASISVRQDVRYSAVTWINTCVYLCGLRGARRIILQMFVMISSKRCCSRRVTQCGVLVVWSPLASRPFSTSSALAKLRSRRRSKGEKRTTFCLSLPWLQPAVPIATPLGKAPAARILLASSGCSCVVQLPVHRQFTDWHCPIDYRSIQDFWPWCCFFAARVYFANRWGFASTCVSTEMSLFFPQNAIRSPVSCREWWVRNPDWQSSIAKTELSSMGTSGCCTGGLFIPAISLIGQTVKGCDMHRNVPTVTNVIYPYRKARVVQSSHLAITLCNYRYPILDPHSFNKHTFYIVICKMC